MFGRSGSRQSLGILQVGLLLSALNLFGFASVAQAETISGALSKAYSFSPDLNQQRAATRATDENLPKALGGYRPTITANGDVGLQHQRTTAIGRNPVEDNSTPRNASLVVQETLFNGYRTPNSVRQSESQILQSREILRQSEQSVLANAATAYMNVLRDTAVLDLQRNNVDVLRQQLKQTEDRFQVGEVTRTDVAQAQSSLASGQASAFTAQSNLQTSLAIYRQLIGVDPKNLSPARPIDGLIPTKLDEAVTLSLVEHPTVQSALHNVDALALAAKITQGQLAPTVNLTGTVQKRYDVAGIPDSRFGSASLVGSITVPIYEGGVVYSGVRQAKELLGQAQLQADLAREQVRSVVVSNWGAFQNTRLIIEANRAAVRAAEIALNGVREEAKVGQRTTLDVLNAQQALLTARVNLVTSQRDQVVNSYLLTQSVGRLSATRLGLNVMTYDPTIHYDQVKDKWIGLRTPDGR